MVVGLHAADFMVLYMGEASVSVGSVMLFDFGKMWKLFFASLSEMSVIGPSKAKISNGRKGDRRGLLPPSRTMPITITTHDESRPRPAWKAAKDEQKIARQCALSGPSPFSFDRGVSHQVFLQV